MDSKQLKELYSANPELFEELYEPDAGRTSMFLKSPKIDIKPGGTNCVGFEI